MTQHKYKSGLTIPDLLRAAGAYVLIALCGRLRRAYREPGMLETTEAELPVSSLPAAWAGARIVLLTDLHARKKEGPGRVDRVVQAALAAGGDMIVLAGDLLARAVRPDYLLDSLRPLSAPGGVFATLGNQDYPSPEPLVDSLGGIGIDTLVNEHRILHRHGQPLCLAGVDDCRDGQPDVAAALGGVAETIPRIVVSHNPDLAEHLPDGVRVDAMLSGHTHGGQVRLWGRGAVALPIDHRKYAAGLVAGPGFPVYISRGLGVVGLPIRFCCLPEIAVLTLVPAAGQDG